MEKIQINIKKINEKAILPNYAHYGDAGLDLYSVESIVIKPNQSFLVKTGICIELPEGYEAQIRPRSGLALNNSITVLNTPGIIDAGYRVEIGVIIINHGTKDFLISENMKIAQMVIAKFIYAEINEVSELSNTEISKKGFGSTGV